ncbi:hypothetical protein DMB38_29905 [Streptomyces sp. WAC 06738]|nr:hypothetical protein DMB38_29905 [Streptomyces sp. WAC 06738]
MAKTSGVVEVSSLHRAEVFVSHRNARLTVHGRRLLVDGRPHHGKDRRGPVTRSCPAPLKPHRERPPAQSPAPVRNGSGAWAACDQFVRCPCPRSWHSIRSADAGHASGWRLVRWAGT